MQDIKICTCRNIAKIPDEDQKLIISDQYNIEKNDIHRGTNETL